MRQPASQSRRRGFMLLEVLVSLAILGVALAMVMRSLTTSIKAARFSKDFTTATMLAGNLMERWELSPPPAGDVSGDFGEAYPGFSYDGKCVHEEIAYDNLTLPSEAGRLEYVRRVSVNVRLARKGEEGAPARRLLHFESAITAGERYGEISRLENKVGFDD